MASNLPITYHPNLKNLTGRRFGRLTVIDRAPNSLARKAKVMWNALCDCGATKIVMGQRLLSGHSKSCGCIVREKTIARNYRHGMRGTLTYRTWAGMIDRCTNPRGEGYRNYGERGITVCDRWRLSFESFLTDMGKRPSPKHSIERRDNSGNYEPSNCCWATVTEQNNNKRTNRYLTFRGEIMTMAQWERRLGMSRDMVSSRLRSGWSTEKTLLTPPRSLGVKTFSPLEDL